MSARRRLQHHNIVKEVPVKSHHLVSSSAFVAKAVAAGAAALCVFGAQAGPVNSASGTVNGVTWQAQSTIVGYNSTATAVAGGDPRYQAAMPQYSGVVGILMDYGAAGRFVCSGTLLNDRQSVLTAAHCVSEGTSARPLSTTVFFYDGPNRDLNVYSEAGPTTRSVSNYFVHSAYTGEVVDQNDIAVLRLSEKAPDFAKSYGLWTGNDLTGQQFNVAGYGGRSDGGGNVGVNLGTGRLRQGDNRYDFRLGDADFGGFFLDPVDWWGDKAEYSYLSDFDNGNAGNDASCAIAGAFALGGAKYCNLGLGEDEVTTAGGDSGGPEFIDGMIASVTSYGLTFGSGFGDIDNALNDTFGEFAGFVPVFLHRDFINSVMVVPAPGTVALALLALGLMTTRRRKA